MKTPPLDPTLLKRMRIVRRDVGDLLFHFTRHPGADSPASSLSEESSATALRSASDVLGKILHEGRLLGTGTWTDGTKCVCFTEAPIAEFASIFALNAIAASARERPRYEPYGIAVSKQWLYLQGGRPVIYDHPDELALLPDCFKHRAVPFDPINGVDYTWEREWRVRSDTLVLDPRHTLVVVPTADEAFALVYGFADIETEYDVEGTSGRGYPVGTYHSPRWLAVSLDLFGLVPGS